MDLETGEARMAQEAPTDGEQPATRTEVPTKEERDALIKKGNVFYVTLGWD